MRVLIAAILLLFACAPYIERTQTMQVTLERRNDAPERCTELMGEFHYACTIRYTAGDCRIIVRDADLETIGGHELKHCADGKYHK